MFYDGYALVSMSMQVINPALLHSTLSTRSTLDAFHGNDVYDVSVQGNPIPHRRARIYTRTWNSAYMHTFHVNTVSAIATGMVFELDLHGSMPNKVLSQ